MGLRPRRQLAEALRRGTAMLEAPPLSLRIIREMHRILGLRKVGLTRTQAQGFYAVHRERPFFNSLVDYMTSGPVFVAALERENAVRHLRDVMSATDPAKADAGTIRKEFGESIEQNAIHGSDSDNNAAIEIAFFFSGAELLM